MIEVKGIKFASSIGVLFQLKQNNHLKTLQETYKIFENADVDSMIEVLRVSYNVANETSVDIEEFFSILTKKGIGFVLIAETFKDLIEDILFSGLSPEEIKERKNQMMKLN